MRLAVPTITLLLHSLSGSAEPADPDSAALSDYLAPYAEYSVDDSYGHFDIERAAQFIDNAAVKWGVKHECVTCHTNGHYLMVPPKLFKHRFQEALKMKPKWLRNGSPEAPGAEAVLAPLYRSFRDPF